MNSSVVNSGLSSVIAKIVKLRALASNNSSDNEVKAATAAADRLMQEYRISQAEVEAVDASQCEPFVQLKVSEGGRRTTWREVLLHALVEHYGCCFYYQSYRSRTTGKGVQSYTVVGRKSDTDIVQYMFTWLESEIQRLGKWHSGGRGVGYATSWLLGCAQGVRRQFSDLREAQRAQQAQSSAMVLLDSRCGESRVAMKQLANTKQGKSVQVSVSNSSALTDGFGVGKSIKITHGLTGGMRPNALGN